MSKKIEDIRTLQKQLAKTKLALIIEKHKQVELTTQYGKVTQKLVKAVGEYESLRETLKVLMPSSMVLRYWSSSANRFVTEIRKVLLSAG